MEYTDASTKVAPFPTDIPTATPTAVPTAIPTAAPTDCAPDDVVGNGVSYPSTDGVPGGVPNDVACHVAYPAAALTGSQSTAAVAEPGCFRTSHATTGSACEPIKEVAALKAGSNAYTRGAITATQAVQAADSTRSRRSGGAGAQRGAEEGGAGGSDSHTAGRRKNRFGGG